MTCPICGQSGHDAPYRLYRKGLEAMQVPMGLGATFQYCGLNDEPRVSYPLGKDADLIVMLIQNQGDGIRRTLTAQRMIQRPRWGLAIALRTMRGLGYIEQSKDARKFWRNLGGDKDKFNRKLLRVVICRSLRFLESTLDAGLRSSESPRNKKKDRHEVTRPTTTRREPANRRAGGRADECQQRTSPGNVLAVTTGRPDGPQG